MNTDLRDWEHSIQQLPPETFERYMHKKRMQGGIEAKHHGQTPR